MVIIEKIISKHIITPSSPTPKQCRNHKLGFLEQIAPRFYIPLVFFYQNDESKLKLPQPVEISRLLRQSLSRILTMFNPLAGTIHDEISAVDCDDSGVEFVESRVQAPISLQQLIQDPKMEDLNQLVPVDPANHTNDVILSLKLSFFDCGGICIGVCLSHKIADANSLVAFMNAWAAETSHRETEIFKPCFDSSTHFPPVTSNYPNPFTIDKCKLTTKRYVFDREKIEMLRQEFAGEVKNPTRVEAVTAFLCREYFIDQRVQSKTASSLTVFHAANLRPRTSPPLPENTFGECSIVTTTLLTDTDDIVSKLRAIIRAVDNDYIKKALYEEYLETSMKVIDLWKTGTELYCFSSWNRFPAYDVDFGWGKPVWVCTTTLPSNNFIIFMSTPAGDGIEAWFNILQD